jgi:CheY-like chemotaxis protein
MVVDDEPTNIFALTLLLKKYHLKADNAYNGLECLKLIKERLGNNTLYQRTKLFLR